MLKMRLQRVGRKNDPSYRIIVTDSRRGPKSGKHVDLLGSHNPRLHVTQIDGEKAKEWISKGVQVSDTVHNLLVSHKIIEGKKINALPRKSPIISEKKEEETKEASTEEVKEESVEEPAAEEVVEKEEETKEEPEVAPEAEEEKTEEK